jgi:DNA-directed RNA polymerase subunit E'/Rpb7
MSNEEIIEELLVEAAEYGLRIEVLDTARKLLKENPKMDRVIAYEEAYNEWIK